MAQLASYQYGKDLVRFLRVVRDPADPARHHLCEYTVRCLLTGASLATSYTQADNSLVVPTDTVKNTIHVLAKSLDGYHVVLVPEMFALHVAHHFLSKYAHLDGVEVDVQSHRWTRIVLDADTSANASGSGTSSNSSSSSSSAPTATEAGPHKHSFQRDGDSLRTARCALSRGASGSADADGDGSSGSSGSSSSSSIRVDVLEGGVRDLLVLKSSGSAFHGYHTDELTTLRPVDDRIFSTAVECVYSIKLPAPLSAFLRPSPYSQPTELKAPTHSKPVPAPSSSKKDPTFRPPIDFDALHARVLHHTLRLFATDASASVQATLFRMASAILSDTTTAAAAAAAPAGNAACAHVQEVAYTLPNKHYVPIDLGFAGLENLGEREAEVFLPQANPSGLIKAKVVRAAAA